MNTKNPFDFATWLALTFWILFVGMIGVFSVTLIYTVVASLITMYLIPTLITMGIFIVAGLIAYYLVVYTSWGKPDTAIIPDSNTGLEW